MEERLHELELPVEILTITTVHEISCKGYSIRSCLLVLVEMIY